MTHYQCIVFWNGFPACAHMLRALSGRYGDRLRVFATPPAVPFSGLGGFLKNEISYIDSPADLLEYYDIISRADIFIHTGWCYHEINRIDRRLKAEGAATKILVLVDNRLKYSIRQMLGAAYFRLFLRQLYDGFIVAGKSATRLMKFFGVLDRRVASGHYGAPSDLYPRWEASESKVQQFTFVGSVDKRKGADLLAEGWRLYKKSGGTWTLKVIGEGPLEAEFLKLSDVSCLSFQQPREVSRVLRDSYAFILPGRDDNWGTVVAEAAASGCILISTKWVGAAEDLIHEKRNGFLITSLSPQAVCDTLMKVDKMSGDKLISMCMESVNYSRDFDTIRLLSAIDKLMAA